MSTKRKIIMPTEEEDAAITAAALSDADAHPLTDAELAQFKPARQRGRPAKANPKVAVNLRLDAEVIDAFKATGDGWQTRINSVLADFVRRAPQSALREHAAAGGAIAAAFAAGMAEGMATGMAETTDTGIAKAAGLREKA